METQTQAKEAIAASHERRIAPDGVPYTKTEFLTYFGDEGEWIWDLAGPFGFGSTAPALPVDDIQIDLSQWRTGSHSNKAGEMQSGGDGVLHLDSRF